MFSKIQKSTTEVEIIVDIVEIIVEIIVIRIIVEVIIIVEESLRFFEAMKMTALNVWSKIITPKTQFGKKRANLFIDVFNMKVYLI